MVPKWIRVLYSDNGALTDYSIEAQDTGFVSGLVAGEDYIYIGQYYPFNNLYFQMNVVNTTSSLLTVQYWTSQGWIDAIDLLDGTKTSGKTLAQSGVIQWTPNPDYGWNEVSRTSDTGNNPVELNSKDILNCYWIRLKVGTTILLTTAIKKISYLFTRDSVLAALDPDVNDYLTNWQAGKTNWIDQILIASESLILDLKSKNIIRSPAQILRFDEIYLATGWKSLAIIYNGLGEKFKEKRDYANSQYKAIMDTIRFSVDLDNNAIHDKEELRSGMLIR